MGNNDKRYLMDEYVSRINRVIDYIETNIDRDLSLERLANVSNFSRFHFHRIFKSMVGETLNGFIRRVRVEKAAALLVNNPRKTITEIAFDLRILWVGGFCQGFQGIFSYECNQMALPGSSRGSQDS